ncbi:hypothetical protein QF037_000718 [Streptomyces canus]|nr:hypothetical protein [Streptomyces canus]
MAADQSAGAAGESEPPVGGDVSGADEGEQRVGSGADEGGGEHGGECDPDCAASMARVEHLYAIAVCMVSSAPVYLLWK